MIAVPAGNLTEMVGQYVAEKTGMTLHPGSFSAMMVLNENQDLVAAVVFTNYRTFDIEISCASETPAAWRPWVCKAIFKFVFEQLGCVRCTATTTRANTKARAFLKSLGFELEGNAKQAYDGRRDALIYGLLRSRCRFLTNDDEALDGKEQPSTAPRAGPGSDSGGADRGE